MVEFERSATSTLLWGSSQECWLSKLGWTCCPGHYVQEISKTESGHGVESSEIEFLLRLHVQDDMSRRAQRSNLDILSSALCQESSKTELGHYVQDTMSRTAPKPNLDIVSRTLCPGSWTAKSPESAKKFKNSMWGIQKIFLPYRHTSIVVVIYLESDQWHDCHHHSPSCAPRRTSQCQCSSPPSPSKFIWD